MTILQNPKKQTSKNISQIRDLKRRLQEAEDVLNAIRSGEVDAVVVAGPKGRQIYTLESADSTYRILIEQMQEGALIINGNNVIAFCNAYFSRMLGYPMEKIVGRSFLEFIPPEYRVDITALNREKKAVRIEIEIQGNKEKIPVYISANVINNLPEPQVCVVVTDLRLEKESANLRIREKNARELAQENAVLVHRAKEDERRKDEFIAILAHELRNPLAPLLVAAKIMQECGATDGQDGKLSPAVFNLLDESVRIVEKQVNIMSRLLDDLLDVSRVIHGKIQLKKTKTDLASIICGAIKTVEQSMPVSSHKISVIMPKHPIYLQADKVRLEQILMNLLNNAVKYTDPGGDIRVSACFANGLATIKVRDNGMGILPDKLANIFKPFFQSERAVYRSQGGLGIGLMLSRNLANLHGGDITVKSDGADKGSEFTLCIPACGSQITTMEHFNDKKTSTIAASKKILLVDDNEDFNRLLVKLFQHYGHNVKSANNGLAALEVAKEFNPEIVLLDIGLPGIDGYEAARRLKKQSSRNAKTMRLVALTGYGQEADIKKSKDAGFDIHLVKPVRMEDLLSAIF